MATTTTSPTTFAWPAEVLEYARRSGIEHRLEPVRALMLGMFPTAVAFRARHEVDPELRGEEWAVLEIDVPRQDVPDYVAAVRDLDRAILKMMPPSESTKIGTEIFRVGE